MPAVGIDPIARQWAAFIGEKMSIFDSLSRKRGASLLKVAFAEDKAITCTLPNGKPLELVGVIVGGIESALVPNDQNSEVVKREVITLRIPVEGNDLPLTIQQKAKFVVPKFGNRIFVPRLEGSVARSAWHTYQLERKPAASLGDKTNGSV